MTGIDENLRAEFEKIADPVFIAGANGRPRFAANRLAERLRDDSPFAVGGELLFRYRDGAYRPDGEEWARKRIIEELGDDWTRARADEVVAYLRDSAPPLLERPPLDLVNYATASSTSRRASCGRTIATSLRPCRSARRSIRAPSLP